jgi:hypothetical protein
VFTIEEGMATINLGQNLSNNSVQMCDKILNYLCGEEDIRLKSNSGFRNVLTTADIHFLMEHQMS